MVRGLAVLLLLFTAAGCGRDEAEPVRQEVAAPVKVEPVVLTALEREAKTRFDKERAAEREKARLDGAVKRAMEAYLFDPASAQYREVRAGRRGAVCGKYNAKNRYGAYVGFKDFVLSRDGETIWFSSNNDGVGSELFGSFAEAYVAACASKKEVRAYEVAMELARYYDTDLMGEADYNAVTNAM